VPDLYRRSIEIILANQHASGAYVACPNFPNYQFCWFRDGSFIAYAMDLAGEHESAALFHAWAARAVNARASVIQRSLERAARRKPLKESDILHTRLTLQGEDIIRSGWGNFQLDGFGTWLWALEKHQELCGEPLPDDWLVAAGLTAKYLAALWDRPCFDCWEEHSTKVHPHTLAAIYGGLKAYNGLNIISKQPAGISNQYDYLSTLAAINQYISDHFVLDGHFVKFSGAPAVDASLLGLAVPYGVVTPDDPLMRVTVAEIERTLVNEGVHRYPTDTYYGGGEWVLLAAWLGWYYCKLDAIVGMDERGFQNKIDGIARWIEQQASPDSSLPEQVPTVLIDPSCYQPWVKKWGPVATPLLWSHAKYIILKKVARRTMI
jgi:GH15 family glucan-1,4-alpha-glucosidase